MDLDSDMMRKALAEAHQAAAEGEAPVGAVIVDPSSGDVVSSAHNRPISLRDPTAHAEILAIRDAARVTGNYRLAGLWIFSTLEPCAMCAGAIVHARLSRVVFGASDPKGGAVLHGPRLFDAPTVNWRPDVLHGVAAEECGTLLRAFFRNRRLDR